MLLLATCCGSNTAQCVRVKAEAVTEVGQSCRLRQMHSVAYMQTEVYKSTNRDCWMGLTVVCRFQLPRQVLRSWTRVYNSGTRTTPFVCGFADLSSLSAHTQHVAFLTCSLYCACLTTAIMSGLHALLMLMLTFCDLCLPYRWS